MDTLCKACGYQRRPTDQAPDWQCPSCGRAYAKYVDRPAATEESATVDESAEQNGSPTDATSHHTVNSCADYLSKFYILPHTYRASFIMRVFAPILGTITFGTPLFLGTILDTLDQRHHPKAHQSFDLSSVFCGTIILCCYIFFLSSMWRKSVISRHSIDITLTLSKTVIPASTVLGYAIDEVRTGKGQRGIRLTIVHQPAGQQQTKTRFTCDPDNLNDPRLRGLFMSMSNYGDVPLTEFLDDVSNDKYPRLYRIVFVGLIILALASLWVCIPPIQHTLEQLRNFPPANH